MSSIRSTFRMICLVICLLLLDNDGGHYLRLYICKIAIDHLKRVITIILSMCISDIFPKIVFISVRMIFQLVHDTAVLRGLEHLLFDHILIYSLSDYNSGYNVQKFIR